MSAQAGAEFATPPLAALNGAATGRRILGAVIAILAAGVLVVAAWLQPAGGGLGTHEQMGLPPCGWITLMDIPCPTCGMTTSFTHAADGNLLAAFRAQPLGAALAVVTAMALLVGSYVAATGSNVARALRRLWGPWSGWIIGGLVIAAWIYKLLSYKGVI